MICKLDDILRFIFEVWTTDVITFCSNMDSCLLDVILIKKESESNKYSNQIGSFSTNSLIFRVQIFPISPIGEA